MKNKETLEEPNPFEYTNTNDFTSMIYNPQEEPKQDRTCTNNCSVVCGECQIFEPKQETLEEVAEKYFKKVSPNVCFYDAVKFGAKWQQEQDKKLYSEEEIIEIINSFEKLCYNYQSNKDWFPSKKTEWFEQFKKK